MIGSSTRRLGPVAGAPGHLRGAARLSTGLLLFAAVTYGSAFRRAGLAARPDLVAALAAALLAMAAVDVLFVLANLRKRRIRIVRAAAAIAFLAGVLLASGGALVARLSRVRGFVLLHEREAVQLAAPGRVPRFETGPLAPRDELGATVQLERVELRSSGGEAVRSSSRVRVVDAAGGAAELEVGSDTPSRFGALLLRQAAFGLAPRITVHRGDNPIFEDCVPFATRTDAGGEVTFSGTATAHGEGLLVTGSVTVRPGDAGAGPRLHVRLADAHDVLGETTLHVGETKTLAKGYRVGFSGMRRWSEIAVSHHDRRDPILLGGVLLLVGALVWPFAAWKRW